jgi:hypothetical protein
MLMAADVAAVYFRERDWRGLDDVQALLADIEVLMADRGLSNSTLSRYEIASAVLALRVKAAERPEPKVQTPEAAAWEASQREGYGDGDPALARMDEIALATRVRSASLAEWPTLRTQLGIAPRHNLDALAGVSNT